MRCSGCAAPISTCWWWGVASPARASRSTLRVAVFAPRSSSGTTSRPAPARAARSSCTAGSGTSTSASSAWCTRASRNGNESSRTRRISSACSPSSSPCSRVAVASIAASRPCSAARCGCTTSPVACASASATTRSASTRHSIASPRSTATGSRGAYVYYDAHADDARLTLTIARTAVAYGAVAMNYAEVVSFERHDGHVVGARIRAGTDETTIRPRAVVERDRRLGRRRARPRRRCPPQDDPTGQGRAHHPAVGARGQHRRGGRSFRPRQPFGLRDPVGGAHLRRHHRHRLRRSPRRADLHRRRSRLPPRRAERRHHREGHERRHRGLVGGAPAPALDRAPRAECRPLATTRRARGSERRRHRDRRQAHHLPPHGRRRGRRRGAGARPPRAAFGDQAPPPPRERRRRS